VKENKFDPEVISTGFQNNFLSKSTPRISSMTEGILSIHKVNNHYYFNVSFFPPFETKRLELEWQDRETGNLIGGTFFAAKNDSYEWTIMAHIYDYEKQKLTKYEKIDNKFVEVEPTYQKILY